MIKKAIFGSLLLMASGSLAQAVQVLSVNFGSAPYTAAPLAGQDGWLAMTTGAGTNAITVAAGGTVSLATSGEDLYKGFDSSSLIGGDGTSVTVTLGGLKVNTAQSGGDYFFALSGPAGSQNYTGRLYAKSTTGGYLLGIIPSSIPGTNPTGVAVTYGSTVLTLTQLYTVSIVYGFVAGTNNDTLSVLVDGNAYTSYSATPFDFGGTNGGLATLGSALLRQGSAGSAATVTLSSIAVDGTLVVVPEPHEYALAVAGLLAVVVVMRRRKAAQVF